MNLPTWLLISHVVATCYLLVKIIVLASRIEDAEDLATRQQRQVERLRDLLIPHVPGVPTQYITEIRTYGCCEIEPGQLSAKAEKALRAAGYNIEEFVTDRNYKVMELLRITP